MGEVIVVTSGKGGVGKTTTTANIGTGLAKLNKKVVLIDTDIGLRNLDVVMGLENRIVYNLVDVVEGSCNFHFNGQNAHLDPSLVQVLQHLHLLTLGVLTVVGSELPRRITVLHYGYQSPVNHFRAITLLHGLQGFLAK